MNVLVIGGTGLLGSYTVMEAMKRGHTVTIMSRGNMEQDQELIRGARWIRGDVYAMPTIDLKDALTGQDAVVYALGLDDRQVHSRPAYKTFHNDHVNVCLNMLRAARDFGVHKFVVFGSYFTHFDRLMPELKLTEHHTYIRTRREQRDAVTRETGPGFDTFVLEIPYIIGSLPGKIPPWTFLFDMLGGNGKSAFFFLKGGTAAVTARQIGEAAVGALEQGEGGKAYPLGGINLTWVELAQRFYSIVGENKKILGLPFIVFKSFGLLNSISLFLRGKERGLAIARFATFQYMNAFIDPGPSMKALGYNHDDYDSALSDMVHEWQKEKNF